MTTWPMACLRGRGADGTAKHDGWRATASASAHEAVQQDRDRDRLCEREHERGQAPAALGRDQAGLHGAAEGERRARDEDGRTDHRERRASAEDEAQPQACLLYTSPSPR